MALEAEHQKQHHWRLQHEASEAARFILQDQVELTFSELKSNKEHFAQQLKYLDKVGFLTEKHPTRTL